MKKFIFFPSFSTGNVAVAMSKKQKMRNGLEISFFSTDFPEQFRHSYYLVTAGHYYKKDNFTKDFGLYDNPEMLILGDSGGYQIATGAIKWDASLVPKIFTWLENNSHLAMNLDIPPRMMFDGKFSEALNISKQNFKYFADNQTGKTKFLNVLQGTDSNTYDVWYNEVKNFTFNGWGVGGATTSIFKMMCAIKTLLHGKEHYKSYNEYLHILGTSKVLDFFIISQLQKSLNDIGSVMQVTTDSSTPSRAVVYGLYYHDVNFKNASFSSLHIPKERAENNKAVTKNTANSISSQESLLPNLIPFDDLLEGGYTYEDLRDWTIEGYAAVVLHNFMFFKDVMHKINSYVEGHPYFLEQVLNADNFMLLKSVDEMVKAYENGTTPAKVFAKYEQLYRKLSTINTTTNITNSKFFKQS
jgi:hypothetical protein